jgi:hypothetical protein
MSDQDTKDKRSKRIHKDEVAIERQVSIAKAHGVDRWLNIDERKHKYAKTHAMRCSNPNCVMCGNPRKFMKEKTMQEKSFDQTKDWES